MIEVEAWVDSFIQISVFSLPEPRLDAFQECGMAGLYTLFIHQQIYITIVLNFSWDGCNTQEKLENMVTPFLFFVVGGEVK